ncbi:MAG: hypothetical protein E7429_04685 [Ruminococcaceae bacterium]|nr:hypothetical protein [Oscillospiraceae bacterium]
MQYWTEKCPYCGKKTRCSSIYNNKKFGCPVVICPSCRQPYIHPDVMEIGTLSKAELRDFKHSMLFSFLWRIAFFAFLIGGVSFMLLENYAYDYRYLGIAAAIAYFVVFARKSNKKTNEIIAKETAESEKRLADPAYRELLNRVGYKAVWNI